MSDELADIIEEAADFIEKHGWTQGHMERRDGTVCMMGGFVANPKLMEMLYTNLSMQEQIVSFIAKAGGWGPMPIPHNPWYQVPQWNDEDGRTEQEVLDLLRKAAKVARE